MPPSRPESCGGPIRWLLPAAGFALAPKCLLCLAAYAGMGAALGVKFGGPELCGASAEQAGGPEVWLAGVGAVVTGIAYWMGFRRVAGAPPLGSQAGTALLAQARDQTIIPQTAHRCGDDPAHFAPARLGVRR